MRVLALDLASRTGWAVDRNDGGPPRTGTYTLYASGNTRGPAFLKFNEWLYAFAGQCNVDLLAYEAPIIGGAPIGQHEAMLLIGLAAQVEMIAAARGVDVAATAVSTVRAYFLGKGNGNLPGPKAKRLVLSRCASLGWETGGDDNRGDAAALWCHTKAQRDPKFNIETTPLFTAEKAARMAGA